MLYSSTQCPKCGGTHMHPPLHPLELCLLQPHALGYPQGWGPRLCRLGQAHLGQADIAAEEVELNCSRVILEGQVALPHDRVSPAHRNSMSIVKLYCTNRITQTNSIYTQCIHTTVLKLVGFPTQYISHAVPILTSTFI